MTFCYHQVLKGSEPSLKCKLYLLKCKLYFFPSFRGIRPEVSYEKSVIKNFANFTGNTCTGISFLLVFAAASATCEKVTYLSKISRVFAEFTATYDDEWY